MIRNVTADLYQIGACVEGERGHEAVRVYVLQNEGHPIIIDCGSQLHRTEIMAELDEVLGGTAPTYVFLTHSELPHSGNLQQIVDRWPDIQVIISSMMIKYIELAPILPLDQILTVDPGTSLELAGRKLQFINALLKDQPATHWIYDVRTGTLFTGDAFGYYHSAGACEQFGDDAITDEGLRDYHRDTFRYLRWVVPEKINKAFDQMFAHYDMQVLAPTHGNAIQGDIAAHLDRMKKTLTTVSNEYRNGGRD